MLLWATLYIGTMASVTGLFHVMSPSSLRRKEHHTNLQVFLRHFILMPEASDTWEKQVLIFLLGVTLFLMQT